jgi:hypothetical protein
MQFTTIAAYPKSHNQPVDSSRTTQGSAIRTGDAGVSLVRDFKASGRVRALVCQKALEHAPARVQHGFRHPRLDKLQIAHVTDDDFLISIYHLPRKLMQGIRPAACGLAMDALGLALMATALG